MKKLALLIALIPTLAFAGGYRYPNVPQGYYEGGQGSSHQGGQYRNPYTGDHYRNYQGQSYQGYNSEGYYAE